MQISNTIRRGLGLALFLAVVGTSTAFAQSTYADKDTQWWSGLETQLTESTTSDVAQVRQEAMQHIIFFAENYADKADFSDAAYEIMARFETSTNVEERLLALAALNAIGDAVALDRLARIAGAEQSPRVRAVAAKVLQNHAS